MYLIRLLYLTIYAELGNIKRKVIMIRNPFHDTLFKSFFL